ncbi:MAG: hypothetical protein IJ744_01215 [Lachnospiraceae bacterium]|nr:hypothetical protein [Lachnospiraceae bacterium]
MSGKYDDIINLERPVSKKHPPMSRLSRAAQFAPFAALTGHAGAIEETAKMHEASLNEAVLYGFGEEEERFWEEEGL